MLAARRVLSAAAAPRRIPSRAWPVTPLIARYSTEAAASESSATTDAPTDTRASSSPSSASPKSKSSPAQSKWAAKAKPNASRPASTSAAPATTTAAAASSAPSAILYQAKSTAYDQAAQAQSKSQGATAAEGGPVDWTASFHGISAKPVSEAQFKALMQPLNDRDIEVKPDGVIYLPEIKYRRRLNEAFGPMGWGMIPRGEPVVGSTIVTREYALIVDGRFVSQAQGENSYFSPDQLPSAVEGCKSNAIMRCCKDLGIASELWDPHFVRWFKKTQMEEVWVEHTVTKKKRTFWYRKGEVDVAYPYRTTK